MPEPLPASQLLGHSIRRLRERSALSQRDFAAQMQELGVQLHHATVAKVEKGTRRVDLDELLALAYALDVAPVHLFVPPDEYTDTMQVEVAPDVTVGPYALRRWIRGDLPLTGQDERRYYSQVPNEEWSKRFGRGAGALVGAAEDLQTSLREGDKAEATNALARLESGIDRLRQQSPWMRSVPRSGGGIVTEDDQEERP